VKVLFRLASFAVGLSLFLCATAVRAQQFPKSPETATMFDEYGRVGGCDHSARLDNMAITLQNDPNLEGYLVYYGPESISEVTLDIIKDYLINSRGLGEERFKTIYAGPNSDPSEPRIQLWLAPQGAPQLEPVKFERKVETFTGLFAERWRWDGIDLGGADGGTGPPVPDVAAPTFIDLLKQRKDTIAYIVGFSGAESAPGAGRRVAQLESEDLQSKGVTSDRMRIIYGGGAEETRVQLWILPENAPPPVRDASAERLPENTIQVSSFGDYELGIERGERWAFKVLLDGLSAGEELRACIIVRLDSLVAPKESEELSDQEASKTDVMLGPDETLGPESAEPEPADLLQLIAKWKAELADKHKIGPERLIVFFRNAGASGGNSVQTWIVPRGARLPNPEAEPGEELADDTTPIEAGKDSDEVKPSKNNPPS